MFVSDTMTLKISNEEMNDLMKMVKSLEESCFLIKDVSKVIKNKAKEEKRGFLSILLDRLGASLLGNALTEKGKFGAAEGEIAASQEQGVIRAGQKF